MDGGEYGAPAWLGCLDVAAYPLGGGYGLRVIP
jgi:hypothetical protein